LETLCVGLSATGKKSCPPKCSSGPLFAVRYHPQQLRAAPEPRLATRLRSTYPRKNCGVTCAAGVANGAVRPRRGREL
jgi:hypothetical protein